MKIKNIITPLFIKNALIALIVFAVGQYVFAVTGKRSTTSIGDDKTAAAESVSFSNLKSKVTFSIKDGYTIPSKNNALRGYKAMPQKSQNNSNIIAKKGNLTYILPYKTQSGIKLPGFIAITPTPSNRR
jgi:lipopolysaccharide export LptBFGC system permease protein LptF